jgi:FkbM family methyltransferase
MTPAGFARNIPLGLAMYGLCSDGLIGRDLVDYLAALGGRYPYDQKFYLESLLHRNPNNLGLMDAYLAVLQALSRNSFGIMHASLPGYAPPLYFRGMTTDVLNIRQIFRDLEYAFEFASPPRRILDLGAYGGYAAIFLANRFPDAEIVCVEPSRTNFRLLRMNTLPYENIKQVHGAVWSHPTQLRLIERIGGDWGSIFDEREGSELDGVRAYTVLELLELAGWQDADYIKCDIEGGELEVFSDPGASGWLSTVTCVSVETHDRFKPGCTDAVEAALPKERFEQARSGEFHVFRRIPDSGVVAAIEGQGTAGKSRRPSLIILAPQTPRLYRFDRVNVSQEEWGFCTIDEDTFQLHPNPPGQGRAELKFYLDLSCQRRFSTLCHLGDQSLWPVTYSVRLVGDNGRSALDETRLVAPGERLKWEFDVPERQGPYDLILGTEMLPPATSNGYAWAQWTRPMLR